MNTEAPIDSSTKGLLFARVEAALESVRQYLREDGGDVKLIHITSNNVAEVELLGECTVCSMSDMTMKLGIEQTIIRAVPEIQKVITIKQ